MSALLLEYPSQYFDGIWLKCRTEQDDVLCLRMTTLSFLLLLLSPSVIFNSDYALILCPLCKSNTLWNSFMVLGRNVESVTYKNDNIGFLTFGVISPSCDLI